MYNGADVVPSLWLPRRGQGESQDMQHAAMERFARSLAHGRSRRSAVALAVSAVGVAVFEVSGAKKKRRRKQGRTEQSGSFPRDCRRFVISAGSDRDDKFRHVDDDLLIEIISKGKNGEAKIILNDNNNAPNGNNGAHLKATPFTARVGDRVHIVARNEVTGGCELDEIWIHCIEGKGGKVQLTESIAPQECRGDANRVGVFFDKTLRIRNS